MVRARRGSRLQLALLCLALSVWAGAPHARADGAQDYGELIREAVGEFERGNWEEAHVLFRRAHALSPNARTFRGLGITAFESRRYVEAISALESALVDENKALTPEQRSEVESVIARARTFVAIYRIRVRPDDAEVLVDGARVDPSRELVLDPGEHAFVARAAGHEDYQAIQRANAGSKNELEIELRPEAQGALSTPPPPNGAPKRRVRSHPWTFSLAGATVAVGAATLGVALVTKKKNDDFERRENDLNCASDPACHQETQELGKRGTRYERAIYGLAGVGGALLVGTTLAYFLERRADKPKQRATLTITPYGMSVHGSF